MVTTVGTESTIGKLVENLLYLEHDAIAAYDAVLERLENAEAKQNITLFRDDHRSHVATLTHMAQDLGVEQPKGGDAKEILTTGKVKLASLMGDGAILKAMKTNEDDTVTAYERASQHADAIERSRTFFAKALADERRHRAWMEGFASRA